MDCTSSWRSGREAEFFWTSGVALVAIAILGFIGSGLILVVLCTSDLKNKVFYKLLIALALFDLFFILSYSALLGYRAFSCGAPDDVIYKITYPILNMSLTGSIYMTMAVSLERHLGICHPLIGARKKSRCYILPVLLFTVAFNFPRLLEKSYAPLEKESSLNISFILPELFSHTHHHVSDSYKTAYYLWASIIFLSVIPLLSLFYLNGSILWKIYKNSNSLKSLTHNYNKDPKATKILLVIVGVFLVCHTPRILYRLVYYLDYDNRNLWLTITPISQLALMINSAMNFFIYCLIGDQFQLEVCQLVRCHRRKDSSSVCMIAMVTH